RLRRREEHDRPYVVDRVSWPVFLLASLLLVLTLIDGMFTLALLDHGFEEANPLLSYFLERDTRLFLVTKYILTVIFLPMALVLNQYRLFGTRLRVGHLVPIAVALYLALIAYQITLWQSRDHARPAPSWPWTTRLVETD